MKLSEPEFKAISSTLRRWLQREVEYPIFKRLGFCGQGADILEIGCGSGYGAQLIASQPFKSYLGFGMYAAQKN